MQVSANSARAAHQAQLRHDDTHNTPIARSGRLVYAKPQDLPSFPSIGLGAKASAASAAATLGWAKKKPPESWRPGVSTSASASASASTAAIMAEDYRSAPARQPAAGDRGANVALLAAQSAARPKAAKPSLTGDGASAPSLASRSQRANASTTNSGALERHRSLIAAQGAVARRRAASAPTPWGSYPDEANAAANALSAATHAHRPTLSRNPPQETGAIPYTTMNRLMYTSRPPVKPEVDEQKRADSLHASAIVMAKKMYNQQQKMIDARKTHGEPSPRGNLEISSSISDDPQPEQLTTLQDAAYKQAQTRLAKMEESNAQNQDLQGLYGKIPLTRRFSVRGKLRKRSLSDGIVIEDQKKSQQINKQMSLFSNKLSEIDKKKREKDHDLLLATAQRNVHEQLRGMDARIATETGMVPPSTPTQWEFTARAVAQSRALQQASRQQGQVDIGGGIHMDQEDINAIAARKVQPVLDEINAKVEQEQAHQIESQMEVERKRAEQEAEKSRQREIHDIEKKLRHQEKLKEKERKAEEKQEARARKEEEKAAKDKHIKSARETMKPTGHDQGTGEGLESPGNIIVMNSNGQPVRIPRPSTQETRTQTSPEIPEECPKSPPGRIKTWFKARFSRGPKSPTDELGQGQEKGKGFIGGVSLTGNRVDKSSTSVGSRSTSERDVAMAGRVVGPYQSQLGGGDPEIIPPLELESDDEFFWSEDGGRQMGMLTPPRPIRDPSPAQKRSPVRDSRFREII
ncbi:hypothetical protein F4802DRAFT_456081 [Xylaria palmicola]|nr:hypothetical protein F4802DRAFT_456081 [Xylaria palmicola]